MALQDKVIDRLKELGVNNGLWLVEVSDYQTAKQFYSDRHIDDLTRFDEPEDTHIIYYHESGSIEQHSTFNPEDQESIESAIKWIAKYLGAEVVICPECGKLTETKGQIVEGEEVTEYIICDSCSHRWNQCSNGRNVII